MTQDTQEKRQRTAVRTTQELPAGRAAVQDAPRDFGAHPGSRADGGSRGATSPTSGAVHTANKAREITEFCVAHGGECFKDWPRLTVFAYVFYHLVDAAALCCGLRDGS